jgi:hypothetical protein
MSPSQAEALGQAASDVLCMVFELAEGGRIGDFLLKHLNCGLRNETWEMVIDQLSHIAVALKSLHERHVLHRYKLDTAPLTIRAD